MLSRTGVSTDRARSVHLARALLIGSLGGIGVVAVAVWLTGSFELLIQPMVRELQRAPARIVPVVTRSAPVRWWRRAGIDAPDLTPAIEQGRRTDVVVEYSWSGGFGRGDVALRLEGNGHCELTLSERRPTGISKYTAEVTASRVGEILSTLRDLDVARLATEARGYHVFDIGRYAIAISAGGASRSVFIDEDTTVDDTEAFMKGRASILSLSKELGVDFDWGPYGWTVGSTD